MHPKILLLSLVFLASYASAQSQNIVEIKGKITDTSDNTELESATVYLQSAQDSTVIDYTTSNREGNFNLEVRKTDLPTVLKISFIGYRMYSKPFDKIDAAVDLGTIKLRPNADQLDEVVVQGEAPPIRIKQDTLEFNASSFKVRPDSNVETLLKELPGIEIDIDGKMTVNGKEVDKVLVNGKAFFGEDGKIATKNLPSDIIEKVQVSDTKTKEEELSGEMASSENKTINLTVKEGKNKGYFGRASAGYGTDDRYEGNLFFNYFNDDQRISVLGSSNNINSIGFSMDEIFDAMGGGRNVWSGGGRGGGINIGGVSFGSTGSGITTSNMAGITFADNFFKDKLEADGSYFYSQTNRENDNRTEQINLTPQGEFITNSESHTENESRSHAFNANFEFDLDSLTTIGFIPNINMTKTSSSSNQNSVSIDENGDLLNESESVNNRSNTNNDFGSRLFIIRRFRKKGHYLNFRFNNNNSENESEGFDRSSTVFYQNSDPDDIRNQRTFNNNKTDSYSLSLRYTFPLLDSVRISTGISYNTNKNTTKREAFNFVESTGDFSDLNDELSRYIESKQNDFNPYINFQLRKRNLRGRLNMGMNFTKYDNAALYMGDKTALKENYVYPSIRGNLRYTVDKGKTWSMNYNYNVTPPSASRLLPVEDLSNPLRTIIGNPDLDPTRSHAINFGFNNYDFAKRRGIFTFLRFNYDENNIVSVTEYDENYKSTTTYTNIDGTFNSSAGLFWNKSYKKGISTFQYRLGVRANLSLNKGITNNESFKSRNLSLSPSTSLAWEYGELLTVEPSYNFNYNQSSYTNYRIDKTSSFRHNFRIQTTSYWPKNVVFGNDFGYTYNSNIADGFRKSFWLWNSSIGYNFYKDKMTFKIKVYDLLDQNVGTMRNISESYIQDVENTVLKRYVMFSLSAKLDKFGGAKPERNTRRSRHRMRFRTRAF